MYTIVKKRSEGKTTDLINIAHANNYPIVCATEASARAVKARSEAMHKPIETMSFHTFLENRNKAHWENVLMDEIIACLGVQFPEIVIGTMSESPLPTYEQLLQDYFRRMRCG